MTLYRAEVNGRAVDGDRVLWHLRQATDGLPEDLSVQVNLFSRDERGVEAGRPVEPDVLVRDGFVSDGEGTELPALVRRAYEANPLQPLR